MRIMDQMHRMLTPRWLGVILLLAALEGCAAFTGQRAVPTAPTTVVVTVNGEPIRQADVDRRVEELVRLAREEAQPPSASQLARIMPRLARAARQELIDKKLIEQAVRAAGIQISDAQVEARIRAMNQEMSREGLSVEGLRASMNVTPERFREMVRIQLAVDTFWDQRLGLKPPTEAELQKCYQDNRKLFVMPAAAHLLEVFVPYPAGRRPTRAERANLKIKAEALRARLLAGEPFATVARDGAAAEQTGSDAVNKLEGDLGWVTEQAPLPQPVLKAALTQPVGKIGEVIETADGYHILLASERREARQVPYEQVKDRMSSQLQLQARNDRMPAEIAKLRKAAKIVGQ